jgi:hypothetical protein
MIVSLYCLSIVRFKSGLFFELFKNIKRLKNGLTTVVKCPATILIIPCMAKIFFYRIRFMLLQTIFFDRTGFYLDRYLTFYGSYMTFISDGYEWSKTGRHESSKTALYGLMYSTTVLVQSR